MTTLELVGPTVMMCPLGRLVTTTTSRHMAVLRAETKKGTGSLGDFHTTARVLLEQNLAVVVHMILKMAEMPDLESANNYSVCMH
jgi:hypothetical protein